MTLPPWTEHGVLPPGAHRAGLDDIHKRMVMDAPHQGVREVLYGALATYLQLVQQVIPAGAAWVNGSFATRGLGPPGDVEVVLLPADWSGLESLDPERRMRLHALVTLQDVVVKNPAVWLSRLQPVGGVVDAYLCYPGQEGLWQRQWGSIIDKEGQITPGSTKGFVEVVW